MSDLELSIELADVVRDLTQDLQGFEKAVDKAIGRAVDKAARWLRTHSAREIGQELGIKQAALKRRFLLSKSGKGAGRQVSVWVGLLAIAAHGVGAVRQNRAGVRVAGRQFDSAFKQRIYGSDEKVYIRASANRDQGHATVTQSGRDWSRYSRPKANAVRAEYGDRFPVQVVAVEIEEVASEVLARYERRLNARFRELLEQELNYAINHEK